MKRARPAWLAPALVLGATAPVAVAIVGLRGADPASWLRLVPLAIAFLAAAPIAWLAWKAPTLAARGLAFALWFGSIPLSALIFPSVVDLSLGVAGLAMSAACGLLFALHFPAARARASRVHGLVLGSGIIAASVAAWASFAAETGLIWKAPALVTSGIGAVGAALALLYTATRGERASARVSASWLLVALAGSAAVAVGAVMWVWFGGAGAALRAGTLLAFAPIPFAWAGRRALAGPRPRDLAGSLRGAVATLLVASALGSAAACAALAAGASADVAAVAAAMAFGLVIALPPVRNRLTRLVGRRQTRELGRLRAAADRLLRPGRDFMTDAEQSAELQVLRMASQSLRVTLLRPWGAPLESSADGLPPGPRRRWSETLANTLRRACEPVFADDPATEETYLGLRSAVADRDAAGYIPLIAGGDLRGVLVFSRKEWGRQYSVPEIDLLGEAGAALARLLPLHLPPLEEPAEAEQASRRPVVPSAESTELAEEGPAAPIASPTRPRGALTPAWTVAARPQPPTTAPSAPTVGRGYPVAVVLEEGGAATADGDQTSHPLPPASEAHESANVQTLKDPYCAPITLARVRPDASQIARAVIASAEAAERAESGIRRPVMRMEVEDEPDDDEPLPEEEPLLPASTTNTDPLDAGDEPTQPHRVLVADAPVDPPALPAAPPPDAAPPVFANSVAMRETLAVLERRAKRDRAFLFVGERGSGKGTLAHHLHGLRCAHAPLEHWRPRRDGDLESACALPDHVARARGGALVVAPLASLGPLAQAALLGLLEELEAHDLLVVGTLVPGAQGDLSPDLLARLGEPINVPPLRERVADLPELAKHLLCELSDGDVCLSASAADALVAYPWPGNGPELSAVLARSVAVFPAGELTPAHLVLGPPPNQDQLDGTYQQIERRALQEALRRAGGNKSLAARRLGLKRTTFLEKLKRAEEEPTLVPPPARSAPSKRALTAASRQQAGSERSTETSAEPLLTSQV